MKGYTTQILKAALKKYSLIINSLLQLSTVLVIVTLPGFSHGEKRDCAQTRYRVEKGVLYVDEVRPSKIVPATGTVLHILTDNERVWYISGDLDTNENKAYFVGMYYPGKEIHFETGIEPANPVLDFGRMQSCETALVFLAKTEAGADIYRVDANSGIVRVYTDVLDFWLLGGVPVLLKKKNEQYVLMNNEEELPLYMDDEPGFSVLAGQRMLHVTDGTTVEIYDTVASKHVYRYTGTATPVEPGDYNCLIEFRQLVNGKRVQGERIFYKVFCDGKEDGRTLTALTESYISYQLMLEPSRMHTIILERWELDKNSDRYRRANNIHQPDVISLYIPDNRAVKLRVLFNGKEFEIHRKILMDP